MQQLELYLWNVDNVNVSALPVAQSSVCLCACVCVEVSYVFVEYLPDIFKRSSPS